MSITKNVLLNCHSYSQWKKMRKISITFNEENWLWKSNLGTFWHLPTELILNIHNILWECWFLGKNLSNFVPPAWNLDNPYTILLSLGTLIFQWLCFSRTHSCGMNQSDLSDTKAMKLYSFERYCRLQSIEPTKKAEKQRKLQSQRGSSKPIYIRCGRVTADNIAYAKFRKTLLIW